jgi:outer membrane protein
LQLVAAEDVALETKPASSAVASAPAGPDATPSPSAAASPSAAPTASAVDSSLSILSAAAPAVPELQPMDDYITRAQRLRPELLLARAAVEQNEAALALAKIAQRPQVTASTGYNLDPRSMGDRRLQVGVGLSIPIFDGGAKRAEVRASQDELGASRINLEQTIKDVVADVETAYVDISGQVERIANARVLVEQAQTSLATATERYQLGLGIVLDVINAQTQLFNAQTSATQAFYDYEIARANLDRAAGRFAWSDPGQPAPADVPIAVPISPDTRAPG